jgi:hypothetical protein
VKSTVLARLQQIKVSLIPAINSANSKKTAKQHSDKIRKLVMDFKLFSATTDKMINAIKSELFYVSGGAPIVGSNHLVV